MPKGFKDKRVLWIAPDFSHYFDTFQKLNASAAAHPFFQELAASLADLPCNTYKYLVAYIPHLIDHVDWMTSNERLIMLETVFQREILILDSIEQLVQSEFAPFLRTDCVYLCKDIEQTVHLHTYFDVFLQDAMNLPPEIADVDFKDKIAYGKSYLNTHLLPHMFLSKMQDRIQQFGMLAFNTPPQDSTADICLVLGNLPHDVEDALYDVLCDLFHNDRVAALVVCNDEANCDYMYLVDRYEGESKYVVTYHTRSNIVSQRSSNIIFRKFASINKRTTTLVFMGTFEFDDRAVRDQWQQRLKEYQSLSLYEPWSWFSIYHDGKQATLQKIQTTCHMIDVLKSWNDIEVTFTVLPNASPSAPSDGASPGDVTEDDGENDCDT